MQALVDFVGEKLTYLSEDQLRQLTALQGGLKDDTKVALDVYLQCRSGTARHQVLLAAYILEKLKEKNLIGGEIYLDPHCQNAEDDRERLVYASTAGYLFVFTPGMRSQES